MSKSSIPFRRVNNHSILIAYFRDVEVTGPEVRAITYKMVIARGGMGRLGPIAKGIARCCILRQLGGCLSTKFT